MPKICDHTSVGMIVRRGNKILIIDRATPPFGFSIPAGHVDEDTNFDDAAVRELKEEVGLDAKNLKLLVEGRKENKCRREDGTWHYWKMYEVETEGDVKVNLGQAKSAGWYTKEEIGKLDGLEPIMEDWFKALEIL